MKRAINLIIIILSWFVTTACSQVANKTPYIEMSSVIVKATSTVDIQMLGGVERGELHQEAIVNAQSEATGSISMSVTDNATATMTLSPWTNPGAVTPTAAITALLLGNVGVASLFDNDLNHCPANANNHCNTAGFAVFMVTTAGLVNSVDNSQIMPISMSGPLTALTVLGTASPGLFLQSLAVAASKHTVQLTDFTPAPLFPVDGNFSSVGAGTYTGTLTVVYFIAN